MKDVLIGGIFIKLLIYIYLYIYSVLLKIVLIRRPIIVKASVLLER